MNRMGGPSPPVTAWSRILSTSTYRLVKVFQKSFGRPGRRVAAVAPFPGADRVAACDVPPARSGTAAAPTVAVLSSHRRLTFPAFSGSPNSSPL